MKARFFELVTAPTDDPDYSKELEASHPEFINRVCELTFADEDFPSRYNALNAIAIHFHALQGRTPLLGLKKKRRCPKFPSGEGY